PYMADSSQPHHTFVPDIDLFLSTLLILSAYYPNAKYSWKSVHSCLHHPQNGTVNPSHSSLLAEWNHILSHLPTYPTTFPSGFWQYSSLSHLENSRNNPVVLD